MSWLPSRCTVPNWFRARSSSSVRRRQGYRPLVEIMEDRFAPAAIRSGFDTTSYGRTDDGAYSGGAQSLGFTINFFGNVHSTVYVNNNGNVTFDSELGTYTPFN